MMDTMFKKYFYNSRKRFHAMIFFFLFFSLSCETVYSLAPTARKFTIKKIMIIKGNIVEEKDEKPAVHTRPSNFLNEIGIRLFKELGVEIFIKKASRNIVDIKRINTLFAAYLDTGDEIEIVCTGPHEISFLDKVLLIIEEILTDDKGILIDDPKFLAKQNYFRKIENIINLSC